VNTRAALVDGEALGESIAWLVIRKKEDELEDFEEKCKQCEKCGETNNT